VLESNNNLELDVIHNLDNYIIQKYIYEQEEYAGHFYIKDGEIKFSVYFRSKNTGYYITKGAIENYEVIENKSFDEEFGKIFSKLNYKGVACTNFKINNIKNNNMLACIDFKVINNNIIIFEINPRLGGSILNNKIYLQKIYDSIINNNKRIN